jgi:dipeptidyl aminopeptidase/acylaminoacyl peptidase
LYGPDARHGAPCTRQHFDRLPQLVRVEEKYSRPDAEPIAYDILPPPALAPNETVGTFRLPRRLAPPGSTIMLSSLLKCHHGIACTLLLLGLRWAAPLAAQRAFTIDDNLKLESFGSAIIDPTGHWLVYVHVPPYDQLPDYSVGRIGTWPGNMSSGGRLMVVDLQSSAPKAVPLFAPDPKKVYWIDSFSPDGKSFAFYAAEGAHVSAGVYGMETKKLFTIDVPPRIDWTSGHTSVWITPTSFVYGAVAEGSAPSALSARGHTGEGLWKAWQKTWKGRSPSVGVNESHADGGGKRFLDGRLVKVDATTGRMEVLATGQFENIVASADGRYIAALKQAEAVQPDPKRLSQDWVNARSQLMLFDLKKNAAARAIAVDRDVFPATLSWAPDRNLLAFFSWPLGGDVRSGIFYALDAETGTLTPYPHTGLDLASERERGWYQRPERTMWIGTRLVVLARALPNANDPPTLTYRDITGRGPNAPPKADWFIIDAKGNKENLSKSLHSISAVPISATATQLFVLADGAAWRLEPGKSPVNLTPNLPFALRHPGTPWGTTARPPFQPYAMFEGRENSKAVFMMLDLQGGKLTRVDAPTSAAEFVAGSASAGAVLFAEEDGTRGTSLELSRTGKPVVRVDHINEFLGKIARTRWVSIKYPGEGGRDIESCVLLPHDYTPGKRYPAVVEVYPGHQADCMNPTRRASYAMAAGPGSFSLHLLAARGYVVLDASAPSAMIQTRDGPVAKLTDVILKGVDAIVAQGYADSNRVGLIGFSQGGFSSLWVTTQTNRFKATVSMNGWSDLFSHYFQGDSQAFGHFYSDEFPYAIEASRYESTAGTDFPIGRSPWEDPMAYVRNSAVFHAPQVRTPIMMIHSDMDGFGLSQYDEMFAALFRLRKEAKLVRYWGEGHSPSSPANIKDMWLKIFDWYAKYLGR